MISVIGIAGILWWRSSSLTLKQKADDLKPEVRVVSVSITDFQGSRIKSTLGIIVTNHLPAEINIHKLEYNIFIDSMISMTGRKKIGVLMHKPNKDLVFFNELFEAGKVVPVIDKRYTLNEVPEAFRYFGVGHAKGKIVIR